ncbi:hypothetical protein [Bacterioplanoides sp.]|uniref:hypothetical protein n=1 Tax=Bacterioplanoides sp. TaxID=2066072 RepID=UPI003B5BFD78
MQLTIVEPDNLTIVDGKTQQFDLSGYELPDHFWALQWQDDKGHIEYNISEVPDRQPDNIDTLPDWTESIIAEHQRLTQEQQKQQDASAAQSLFISNGQARKHRVKKQTRARAKQEQQTINQFVREQMT